MLDETIEPWPTTLTDWYNDLIDDRMPTVIEVEECLDGRN